MVNSLTLHAPAKLNLYLKVHGRRPDGFHDIETLFERIDLQDCLTFQSLPSGDIQVACDHPDVPVGPDNLVYQAIHRLKQDRSLPCGVRVTITKRIPVAAGLAGGSTDAATALMGVNRLWGLGLSRDELFPYAASVGSDVAFFLYDSPWALGTGRGEQIEEVFLEEQFWHVLVAPEIKVYARDVYAGLSKTLPNRLTRPRDNVKILIRSLKKRDLPAIERGISNDLEDVVIGICPFLEKVKQKVRALGISRVMVSGSGPTLFGMTRTEQEARNASRELKKDFNRVFVVKTSDRRSQFPEDR